MKVFSSGNTTEALVTQTKALVTQTEALVTQTEALVTQTEALVTQTKALVTQTKFNERFYNKIFGVQLVYTIVSFFWRGGNLWR